MPGFHCFFLGLLPTGVPISVIEDYFHSIYLKNFCRYKNAKCMIIQCTKNSTLIKQVPHISSTGVEVLQSRSYPTFTLETRIIYNEAQFHTVFTPENSHLPCYYYNPVNQTLVLTEVHPTSKILKLQKFLPDSDTDSDTECQPPKKTVALMQNFPNLQINN